MNQEVQQTLCRCPLSDSTIAKFKRCAYYQNSDVVVMVKDCSYWSKMVNPWLNIFWENHRPWYASWKKCVGFSVYCPPALGLTGDVYVEDVLDKVRVESKIWDVFGKYENRVYRLAVGLFVQIP